MKKNILSFTFFLMGIQFAYSQSNNINVQCGFNPTDLRYQETKTSIGLKKNQAKLQQKSVLAKTPIISVADDPNTIYNLPVVFIVYHTGQTVGQGINISDNTITSVFAKMKSHFRGLTPGVGPDTKINFELVKRDVNCNTSNGIIRINASQYPTYGTAQVLNTTLRYDLKDMTAYGQDELKKQIIIRVVSNLGANGYATFGGEMYLDVSLFSNIDRAAAIATHEMGHIFSLSHTFQGSTYNSSTGQFSCPSSDQDGVADTQIHKESDSDCSNSAAINSCTGLAFGNLLNNYMTYAPYTCTNRFTAGQIAKMRDYIVNSLQYWLTSLSLTPPNPTDGIKPINCQVTTGTIATGNYDTGIYGVSLNDIFYLSPDVPKVYGYVHNYSCENRTNLNVGQEYEFIIVAYHYKVYIDYNDDGQFNETNELVGTDIEYITIPTIGIVLNKYLRMRIVSYYPITNPATACNLPSHPTYGYGEVEDYAVKLIDPNAPVFSLTAPANINTTTNTACTKTGLSLGTPTCNNCTIVTSTNNAPTIFPLGTTTVVWSVTTSTSATLTASQTIIVTDNTVPTITAPMALNINPNAGCTATGVSLGSPITADNCIVASVTNNAPSTFPIGNTTVVWTVTDGSGNINTASQTVTVSSNVILSSPIDDVNSGTILRQANATTGTITATNKITGTANVIYRAGKSITLKAGFKADNGVVFKTEFGGCN